MANSFVQLLIHCEDLLFWFYMIVNWVSVGCWTFGTTKQAIQSSKIVEIYQMFCNVSVCTHLFSSRLPTTDGEDRSLAHGTYGYPALTSSSSVAEGTLQNRSAVWTPEGCALNSTAKANWQVLEHSSSAAREIADACVCVCEQITIPAVSSETQCFWQDYCFN